MPTLPSAPLPELDWPTQTSIFVDAGDPNAVVESLIILVSENAPLTPGDLEDQRPVYLQQGEPGYAGMASAQMPPLRTRDTARAWSHLDRALGSNTGNAWRAIRRSRERLRRLLK